MEKRLSENNVHGPVYSRYAHDFNSLLESGLSVSEPCGPQPSLPASPRRLYLYGRLLFRDVVPPLQAVVGQQPPFVVAHDRFVGFVEETAVILDSLSGDHGKMAPIISVTIKKGREGMTRGGLDNTHTFNHSLSSCSLYDPSGDVNVAALLSRSSHLSKYEAKITFSSRTGDAMLLRSLIVPREASTTNAKAVV